jgi:hypothetical protein
MDHDHDRYIRTNKEERTMKRIVGHLLFMFAAVTLFTGCLATEVTSTWKDPSYQGSPKKILVYSLLKSRMQRRVMEDEFVAHFKYRGINAVPGYEVFPGDELATKEVLKEKLISEGFDTLLLSRVTGTRKEQAYVPTYTYQPSYTYPSYYSAGYSATYSSSYMVEDYYATTETSLFDVASEKMIWSGAGDTWINDKEQKIIKDYVALMMEAIRKSKVVP